MPLTMKPILESKQLWTKTKLNHCWQYLLVFFDVAPHTYLYQKKYVQIKVINNGK